MVNSLKKSAIIFFMKKNTAFVFIPLFALLFASCNKTPSKKRKSSSLNPTSQTSSPTSGISPTSEGGITSKENPSSGQTPSGTSSVEPDPELPDPTYTKPDPSTFLFPDPEMPEPDPVLDTYYQSITTQKGEELKTALYKVIGYTDEIGSYDDLYDTYRKVDVRPDGNHLWDIYSDTNDFTLNDSRINNSYKKEGDSLNREHMIPQSVFNEASPMKNDPHHVLPSDGYVNNRRSNFPHGVVTGKVEYASSCGGKLGTDKDGTRVFEPLARYKGDTARIYFYFVTCYQNRIPNYNYDVFAKNTYPSLNTKYLELYLRWHLTDTVSAKEVVRNNAIYQIQHNRNPYIDHPEYACNIWGSLTATTRKLCGM